jgi:CubicO group peptidase (beta-lactamase class C family)
MIRHITGRELDVYVQEHLAAPLGWQHWGWGYKNAKSQKHIPGGGGIAVRPTDMLRFGYLLLRKGRWEDRQLIPAEYVAAATSQSKYNPHSPYSLQFDVNTDGDYSELPRDAFWKGGSGGHVLYVVPSLDLVVWKLGGREPQYLSEDTGLATGEAASAESRTDWKELVDSRTAQIETLKRVIGALRKPAD